MHILLLNAEYIHLLQGAKMVERFEYKLKRPRFDCSSGPLVSYFEKCDKQNENIVIDLRMHMNGNI